MMLKNVIVDTTKMTYQEVDALIQNLRKIRERKKELKGKLENFQFMIANMRNEERMTFVNKYTGEILNPDDWELYDDINQTFYREERE